MDSSSVVAPHSSKPIRNSKRRGEWVELLFMTRAAEQGIMISKPWGDSAPYDFMVEHNGRVLRIQVKSTMRLVRGIYRCHLPKGRCAPQTNRAHSLPRQIDFVAAYIIPEDLWYILPYRVIAPLRDLIYLNPHRPGHKYQPYVEAWHLLL